MACSFGRNSTVVVRVGIVWVVAVTMAACFIFVVKVTELKSSVAGGVLGVVGSYFNVLKPGYCSIRHFGCFPA